MSPGRKFAERHGYGLVTRLIFEVWFFVAVLTMLVAFHISI